MRTAIRRIIKNSIKRMGYNVYNIKAHKHNTAHKFLGEIAGLLKNKLEPVVFDIGANTGQTIDKFKKYFPASKIYAFEPGPGSFSELEKNHQQRVGVRLENLAVGSASGSKEFLENKCSDMSSFLEMDEECWGSIERETVVNMMSIDDYCALHHIDHIDVLKSDTQGYEFEVLKGATNMIRANRIHLIYFEFILSEQYKNLPSFGEMYQFLDERNFRLVNFYDFHYQNGFLGWGDVLFVNRCYELKENTTC